MLDDPTIRRFLMDDYPRLVNAVSLICGSFATGEDAVQEALVRAWTRSSRGESIGALANWVAAVAINRSRSQWRRNRAEAHAHARARELQPVADPAGERHVELQQALSALPRRQREVAVLRYLIEMSTRETATTLGVSEGTVKNSLAKARAALADALRITESEVNDVEDR